MRRLIALAVGVALCGAASEARTECRAEVRPFEGPSRRAVRAEVRDEIATRCTIVKPGARGRVDVVVEGEVRRGPHDSLRVKLWVKDGETGASVRTVKATLDGPRLDRRTRKALHDRLDAYLEEEEEVEDEPDDESCEPATAARTPSPRRARMSLAVAPAADPRAIADVASSVIEMDEDVLSQARHVSAGTESRAHALALAPEPPSPPPSRRASRVSVGSSIVDRSLAFVARPDLVDAPRALDVRTTGVHATGELYPLSGSLSGLGLGFVAEKALTVSHDVPAADAVSGASASASQLRWGVGLRYRQPLGAAGTALTAGLGYNELVFAMDRQVTLPPAMAGTPDTHYRYLDPSLSLHQPLAAHTALVATVRAWLFLDAGAIVQHEEYGQADLTGFDAELALEYTLAARYPLRAGARYGVIGYDFVGDGERARADDGDRSTLDIGGARDRYLACALTAGYLW